MVEGLPHGQVSQFGPAARASFPTLDFLARIADAWDGRGNHVFLQIEHFALLRLARLPEELASRPWAALAGADRQRLLFASRIAIEFGRQCAWVFGEGQGARL